MPTVTINGVGNVDFPDSMSQADIQSAIETHILPQSQTPNYLSTLSNGIAKGAAGVGDMLLNTPRNIANLGKMAFGTAATALGHPDLAPDVQAPTNTLHDLAQSAGLIQPQNEPTNSLGRVLDTTGQVLGGGGINPAAMARNVAQGAVPTIARDLGQGLASGLGAGVGQELASKVDTGNQAANTAIQMGGAMLGGGAAGFAPAKLSTAGERAQVALRGTTPQQIEQAQALQTMAAGAKNPLTATEALQSVTGLNPQMQTLQRMAEQSKQAPESGLTGMIQNRPQANRTQFFQAANQISPVMPDPSTLAGAMQTASKGAIQTQRDVGNAAAQPFYAQADRAILPPATWQAITADPAVAAAVAAVKRDPLSGMANVPDGSVKLLDSAKKYLNDQSNAAAQTGQNFRASNATGAAQNITGQLDPLVPAYAQARGIVQQNMQNNVTPMQQGQIGKLAESNDFNTQARTLLPNAPSDVTPATLQNTISKLNAENPGITNRFIGQDLRNQFNEAAQLKAGGENLAGGAAFAAKVAGNANQRANLSTALSSGGANQQPLQDFLTIAKAQGFRPPVTSTADASRAEGALHRGLNWGDMTQPFSILPRAVDTLQNSMATKQITPLMTNPNGVKQLNELARLNGSYDPVTQLKLAAALRAQQIADQQQR